MTRLTIGSKAFRTLSTATQEELLNLLLGKRAQQNPRDGDPQLDPAIDMEGRVHLTPKEVATWMEKASDKTKAGLRIFAERGPAVYVRDLIAAGFDNLAHFQSRTTIRTRTVTGDADAFLLGWDDWSAVARGGGRYAVSPETYKSLRHYFRLD